VTLPIRRVVVHPDGAVVHREGVLTASGGAVTAGGLPWLLDPTSVRVEGAGLGEVEVDLDPASLEPPALTATAAELADAELRVRRLAAEEEGLRHARSLLTRLSPTWDDASVREGTATPTPHTLAAWVRADAAAADQLVALDAELARVARDRHLAEERRAVVAARAATESGEAAWRRVAPSRQVRVRVASDGPVHLAVSYVVPGAAWSPSYVLDAEPGLAKGVFSLRALVVQATGEDWRGVALALSTAPVARRVDLPALRSLRLSARQERPAPAWRDLPADLDTLFPSAPPPPPAPPAPPPGARGAGRPRRAAGPGPGARPAQPGRGPGQVRGEPAGGGGGRPRGGVRWWRRRGRAAGSPRPAPPAGRRSRAEDRGGGSGPGRAAGGRPRLRPAAARGARGGPRSPRAAVRRLRRGARLRAVRRGVGRGGSGRPSSGARCEAVGRAPWPPGHVVAGPVSGNDRVFAVDGEVDLPADGHLHRVAVTSWPASLAVSYRAVPRQDPRAWRLVDARLEGGQGSLLPGPVEVLVGGRLELTTPWAGSAGRGHLRLGLGPEDRLKIARNVRYKDESAGLFGGSRRISTHVEVQVASALPSAVRVELLDRLPVPADKETLTVELTEASPTADPWKGDGERPAPKGGRVQRLEVPAGGEARAVFAYAVTVAARDELVGGDHRG
jgi:hypothetical protein